ncbi:hypothetical protein HAX54_040573, partial [Datura stramonium]|nr:hypothetical protein [Datura stramonium]
PTKNLDNVELTKAQLTTACDAQQGGRNHPLNVRRASLVEEINLEQVGYAGAIVLSELGRNA